jgi:hypothetical protein
VRRDRDFDVCRDRDFDVCRDPDFDVCRDPDFDVCCDRESNVRCVCSEPTMAFVNTHTANKGLADGVPSSLLLIGIRVSLAVETLCL